MHPIQAPPTSAQPFAIVVEDDAPTRVMMLRIVRHHGFRPIAFATAEDALTWLERQPAPALITIDLDLPGMSGETLCVILRRLPHLKTVPIVLVSSKVTRRDAAVVGATATLRKPFDGDTLLAVLQRVASSGASSSGASSSGASSSGASSAPAPASSSTPSVDPPPGPPT